MSISNLFVQNDYDIYADSLTINDLIVDQNILVNGNETIAGALNVSGVITTTNGLVFDNAAAGQINVNTNYKETGTLSFDNNGLIVGPFNVVYYRFGNMVQIQFDTGITFTTPNPCSPNTFSTTSIPATFIPSVNTTSFCACEFTKVGTIYESSGPVVISNLGVITFYVGAGLPTPDVTTPLSFGGTGAIPNWCIYYFI